MAAQQIGIVNATKGEVFARNPEGQVRRLGKGDPVFEQDLVITAAGSSAQIEPTNGPMINVNEQQTVSADGTVVMGTSASPTTPLTAAEAARVIEDPNALIEEEAAAAGLTGGDGGAGHGFVDLARVTEGVGGAAYDFPVYDRGGPQLPGAGGDIESALPAAGNLDLGAWSDNDNDGVLDAPGDNQPETFTVTSTPVLNDANASAWIGGLLKEGVALTPGQIAGSAPKDVTLKTTSDITFTFLSEGAGYQNAVGWYDVKDPTVGYIVWDNSSAKGSDGSLVGGVSTVTVPDVPAGTQIGFFLIPDAFSPEGSGAKNVPVAGSTVYFDEGHAYTDAAHQNLINSTDNGMLGNRDADPVWFSNNPNPDGLQHAITGLGGPGSPANLLYVGFEDLGNGGDKDYNDIVFTVDLGEGNDVQFDPVVFDLGVSINSSGELKMATIDFTLGDGDTISFDNAFAASKGLEVTKDAGDIYTIKAIDGSEPAESFDGLLDTFQVNVGFTGTGQDYTQVDDADRLAEVKVFDAYGNFDVATAVFDLNVVLPKLPVDAV